MANDVKKKQPINFCLTNGRDVMYAKRCTVDLYFAKSEQIYNLTSTDAEAVAVKITLPTSQEETYTRVIHTSLYALYAYM